MMGQLSIRPTFSEIIANALLKDLDASKYVSEHDGAVYLTGDQLRITKLEDKFHVAICKHGIELAGWDEIEFSANDIMIISDLHVSLRVEFDK